jgi:inhibitor of cysteine peptidase
MHVLVEERDDGRTFECAPGDTLGLSLPENPSTGFRWTLADSYRLCLTLTGHEFEAADATPGRPGRHIWRFMARDEGECDIELTLTRLQQSVPAQSFDAHVRVRRAQNL